MKKAMIWAATMMILVAGMVVTSASSAEAGLFNCNKCGKLIGKLLNRQQQTSCEAAPEAPEGEVQACGCETTDCCVTQCSCLNKRQLRRAQRKGKCCDSSEEPSCNEAAPEAPEGDATT